MNPMRVAMNARNFTPFLRIFCWREGCFLRVSKRTKVGLGTVGYNIYVITLL